LVILLFIQEIIFYLQFDIVKRGNDDSSLVKRDAERFRITENEGDVNTEDYDFIYKNANTDASKFSEKIVEKEKTEDVNFVDNYRDDDYVNNNLGNNDNFDDNNQNNFEGDYIEGDNMEMDAIMNNLKNNNNFGDFKFGDVNGGGGKFTIVTTRIIVNGKEIKGGNLKDMMVNFNF